MKLGRCLQLGFAGALICSLLPGQTYARPLIESGESISQGYSIEFGGISHFGASEFAVTGGDGIHPKANGLVLRDHHGVTARALMGMIVILGGAAAASSPKSVESKSYQSGDYIVTETTTTYHSPEEQRAIMAGATGAAAGLFTVPMADFDLQIFGRDRLGWGDSSGYKLNMLFGGGSKNLYFEMGMGWGSVDSIVTKDSVVYGIDHKYFGIPVKIGGSTRLFAWAVQYEWNLAQYGVDSEDKEAMDPVTGMLKTSQTVAHSPLSIDIEAGLFGLLYGQIGATFPSVSKLQAGYHASAGFRF